MSDETPAGRETLEMRLRNEASYLYFMMGEDLGGSLKRVADVMLEAAAALAAQPAAPPAAGAPPAPGWPDGNNAVRWEANRDVQPVLSAVPNHAEGAQETQGLPRGDSDGSHSPVVGAPPDLVALVDYVLACAWQLDNKPHLLFSSLRRLAVALPNDVTDTTVRLLDEARDRAHLLLSPALAPADTRRPAGRAHDQG